MKKKFLALVVGATLGSLVVGGAAQASCVKVFAVTPAKTHQNFGIYDSSCGSDTQDYDNYNVNSTSPSTILLNGDQGLSPGSHIYVYKYVNGISIGSGVYPVPKNVAAAILDCTTGSYSCKWTT